MAPSGGELLLVLLTVNTFAQEILHPPENATVFQSQTATFTCETRGGTTSWRVNGTQREILLPTIPGGDLNNSESTTTQGNTEEILTLRARARYNGTTVQCLSAIIGGPRVESENVTLTIEGPPSSPTNLTATSNGTSVTVSWSPPFSLIPDIWYSVFIYNVTDETNPTAILCTNCTNITETHYTFTPDSTTPCEKFLFSVIPFNGAGKGESSHNITECVFDSSALIRTVLQAISRDRCSVTFKSDDLACNWTVVPDVMDDRVIQKPPSPVGPVVTYQLRADYKYSFRLSIFIATEGVAASPIIFTTNDVQSAAASTNGTNGTNNMILMTGKFIEETRAKGCFVVLQCQYGSPDVFIALLLPKDFSGSVESTIDGVPASTYSVLVYDLEEDGLPNTKPAVEQSKTFTVIGKDSVSDTESNILKSASFNLSGSVVLLTCEFKEGVAGASCVLVYREYGNETVVVVEYPQSTDFPVTVTVDDNLENYTFAVFGKDGSSVDERPVITERLSVIMASTPPTTTATTVSTTSDGSISLAVGVSVGLSGVIIIIVVVAMILLLGWKKVHKDGYELIPSAFCCPTTSSNDIDLCSNVSGGSDSGLISDSGAKKKKNSYPEAEAKPLPSAKSSHLRHDSDIITPPLMSKQKGTTYTDVAISKSETQPPPPEDSRVQYAGINIKATHNMARSEYAKLGALPTSRFLTFDEDTKPQYPYVTVLPHATTPITDNSNNDKESVENTAPKGPPKVESVMLLLMGVAGRWREIAEGLGFDDVIEDEIYTNNSTDEACLQDCVEQWIARLQPSWEKLSHVLRDRGEEELAEKAWSGDGKLQTMNRQLSVSCSGIGSSYTPVTPRSIRSEVVTGAHELKNLPNSNCDDTRGAKTRMLAENKQCEGKSPIVFLVHTSDETSVTGECEYVFPQQCSTDEKNNEIVVPSVPAPSAPLLLDADDFCLVLGNIIIAPSETDSNDDYSKSPEQTNENFHIDSLCAEKPSALPKSEYSGSGERKIQKVATPQYPSLGRFCEADIKSSPHKEVDQLLEEEWDFVEHVSCKCTDRFEKVEKMIAASFFHRGGNGMMVTGDLLTKRHRIVNEGFAQQPEPVAEKAAPLFLSSFGELGFQDEQEEPQAVSLKPAKASPAPFALYIRGVLQQPRRRLLKNVFFVTPHPKETISLTQEFDCPGEGTHEFQPGVRVQQQPQGKSSQQRPRCPKSNMKRNKVSTPFKKHQVSNPPENYHEKIIKWFHCGIALGFNGLGNVINAGSYPAMG